MRKLTSPCLYKRNITSLRSSLLGITLFVIVRCRQSKILKNTAQFGVSSSQGARNVEAATQRCFAELAV